MTSLVHFQVKISFDDHATTTFEYEGEESALQNYLIDHPEEKEEVLKQVGAFNAPNYRDLLDNGL